LSDKQFVSSFAANFSCRAYFYSEVSEIFVNDNFLRWNKIFVWCEKEMVAGRHQKAWRFRLCCASQGIYDRKGTVFVTYESTKEDFILHC